MKKISLLIFGIISLAVLVSIVFESSFMHHLFKPLIMVSLMIFYGVSVPREYRSMTVWVAMFFSFLGDTLLMYENRDSLYFIFGLVAFLLSHIFYIFSYRQHRWDTAVSQLQGLQRIRLAFPVILAGTGLVVILYPTLGDLRIPVILYATVMVVMVLTAMARYGRTDFYSFVMVSMGAISFMISDSILAINKFLQPISGAGVWIMVSYIGAQYLIVAGLIRHFNK